MTCCPNQAVNTFLGIEGGGTRTVALLADARDRELQRLETGPANLKLLTDSQLAHQFRSLAASFPLPAALGIGLAGAWNEADWSRIRAAAAQAWPGIPCVAANDLETALRAAAPVKDAAGCPQVLMVSGTGSACYGRTEVGQMVKVGGWGHLLGDEGSGYALGLRALQAVARYYDEKGGWPPLGARLLRVLLLNESNDLIDWAQIAPKSAVAGLAPEVLASWNDPDRLARSILTDAANRLAQDAAICAHKLASPGQRIQFVLCGGLLRQKRFAALVSRRLRSLWPAAIVTPLARESVWGAVALAKTACQPQSGVSHETPIRHPRSPAIPAVSTSQLSPTEQRNPLTYNLDKMPLREAINLMLSEDAKVPLQLLPEAPRLERVVRAIVRAFQNRGRLFYVGAGTSGRLGVLDASECPPTFRTSPDLVQGVMAGGHYALWQSIEGAEDDAAAGARTLQFRRITARDVVVGLAASGTTPFVWGALQAAKNRGAFTVILCFNPFLKIPKALRPDVVLAPNVGPELLTGSTRLKAGTATKLLLNLFTTLAMVQFGKVISNLMIDVSPSNVKLRARARRILHELTGATEAQAQAALEASGWDVKGAARRLGMK